MNTNKVFIAGLFFTAVLTFQACKEHVKDSKATAAEHLAPVDKLMADLAGSPQRFYVSSDKQTDIRGKNGSVIHIDPSMLETSDASPLGKKIEVQLIEMTDKASLLLHHAATVSDGKLLISGGAYYLNMLSDGKALQIKQGKALQVEFPKLNSERMQLFTGDKDSLGQMNWKPTSTTLASKKPAIKDTGGRVEKRFIRRTYDEFDALMDYVKGDSTAKAVVREEEVSEADYNTHIKRKAAHETAQKTYESVGILKFGWINCDYFWPGKEELTDISMVVANDSIRSARFFGVFKDVRSVLEASYWQDHTPTFANIPVGRELHVVALATIGTQSYIFEQTINSAKEKKLKVHFTPVKLDEIKQRLTALN